jgi:6-phosphogluconolactonase (cycloisomerase 2 family)
MVYLETGLDWMRGMRISDDGMYLACCGEVGGGLEVYEIGGERGEVLSLVGKVEGVKDVNCVLWV